MKCSIIIHSHDARWKGLGPTVKRAAEMAFSDVSFQRMLESSPNNNSRRRHGALDSRLRGNDKLSVTIVLTHDAEVQQLNATYRGKNKPTNVLSFPDGEVEEGVKQLGDIVLAYETIAAEADTQQKKLKHHLSHLVIHGVLHLAGYDHENDKDAKRMEALEILLLERMGIANPYEAS